MACKKKIRWYLFCKGETPIYPLIPQMIRFHRDVGESDENVTCDAMSASIQREAGKCVF